LAERVTSWEKRLSLYEGGRCVAVTFGCRGGGLLSWCDS
jgi:hypothetical protein